MADSFVGQSAPLDDDGLDQALELLGVGPPELWAVLSVETGGSGFLPDRRPRILFERHIFSKQTRGQFDSQFPNLSNNTPGGYKGGEAEYDRLTDAIALDRTAALKSTSWGLGQVMGFNAEAAGFSDVETMVREMVDSEATQLAGMAQWIVGKGLAGSLRSRRWEDFARTYNGPGYKRNQYNVRLAGEYQKFKVGPLPDLRVRVAQTYLVFLGYSLGRIDGVMGRLTRAAIQSFQSDQHMPATGQVSSDLVRTLKAEVDNRG